MGSGKGQAKRVQVNSTSNKLRTKYYGGVDYLNDNFAYFLTHILNIGNPEQSNSIDTACVGFYDLKSHQKISDSDLSNFKFYFNTEFADSLTDNEMGFVLAHETMHILLNHLSLSKQFEDKQLFNIAADAVINDYLVSMGLEMIMRKNKESGKLEPFGITGQNTVGYNCANSTVRSVYDELYHKNKQEEFSLNDLIDELSKQTIDNHDWMNEQEEYNPDDTGSNSNGQQIIKAIEEATSEAVNNGMPEDLQEKREEDIMGENLEASASKGGINSTQKLDFKENGVTLKWKELLKEIDPDIFSEKGRKKPPPDHTYARPNRKTGYMYPDVLLPGLIDDPPSNKKQKESIVMALDVSGSIGQKQANDFLNLVRSIPKDKVEVHVCTFTEKYHVVDMENPKIRCGGNESFTAISEFIKNEVMPTNKNQYPKAVVVLTDGYSEFYNGQQPNPEEAKSWHWLLTTDNTHRSYYSDWYKEVDSIGVKHKLQDFVD